MAIPKELFRQKVNISTDLANSYVENFKFSTRHPINKFLLTDVDLGTQFVYQDRTFTIHGMTQSELIIVTEIVDGRLFYWEVTASFVQMRLGRFYTEWRNNGVNGKTESLKKEYEINNLYLPSPKPSRKKKDTNDELPEDDFIMETYTEESETVNEF